MKDLNKVLMFVFMAIGAALVKWGGDVRQGEQDDLFGSAS